MSDEILSASEVQLCRETHACDALCDSHEALRAERDGLVTQLREAEAAVTEEIRHRDDATEWADRLAYAIAPQSVIGEHSSHNNPWQNALDLDRVAALTEALPRVPWGENDECYACGSGEGDEHFDGCAWVAARAVLGETP